MIRNVNCIYTDDHAWCINKNIKRSLCGLGARCCVKYYNNVKCEFQVKHKRPDPPLPQPRK
jgi:hypothetical protein